MEKDIWYYLDPNHRKDDPKTGLFCCRCKRKLKETQCFESFISVEMHPEHYWVKIKPMGDYLLGSECAKQLDKVPIDIVEKHG